MAMDLVGKILALADNVADHRFSRMNDLLSVLQSASHIQYGTYTGTGVALDVTTDGDPILVIVSDTSQNTIGVHIKGMTDAHFFKIKTAAVAHTAANGITLGTDKFTIGTDSDINTNTDTGFWLAFMHGKNMGAT